MYQLRATLTDAQVGWERLHTIGSEAHDIELGICQVQASSELWCVDWPPMLFRVRRKYSIVNPNPPE